MTSPTPEGPRVAGEWLPIEDAPSNVLVLLFSPVDLGQRIEVGYASHGWPRNSLGISNMSYHGHATHWMPLPPEPTTSGREGERG